MGSGEKLAGLLTINFILKLTSRDELNWIESREL